LAIAGPVVGTTAMDIKGSVFGDDSTLLVDGVNGVIPTSVLQGDISNDIKSSDIVIETTTSPGSISLTQTGIGNISISGTAIDFNNSPIQNFILSTLSSGLTAPGSAVVAGDTEINFNFSMAPTALTVEQDAITIGSGVTVNGFVGDIKGSVFGDDSTLLVDGVNGNIPYSVISGLPNNTGVAYQYGYSAHDAESTAGSDFTVNSVTTTISLTASANAQGARIDISGITTNSSAGTGLIYIQRRVNTGSWSVWNAFVVDGAGDHFSHSFVDFYDTGGATFDVSAGDTVEYKLTNGTNNTNYNGNSSGDVDFELFFGFQFTATEIPVSYSLTQP